MNLEELQKYLDENNLTLEQYLRNNMITDEDRKYFDKIWVDVIYKEFGKGHLKNWHRSTLQGLQMPYNDFIHTDTL